MKFSTCGILECVEFFNEFRWHCTCVICCVVVRILANGLQQTGNVSNNVGLECVNRGFMYLVSKSPQILARNAFSLGFMPPMPALLLPPPGNDPSCIELYCETWTIHQLSILYDSASFPFLIFKRKWTSFPLLFINNLNFIKIRSEYTLLLHNFSLFKHKGVQQC